MKLKTAFNLTVAMARSSKLLLLLVVLQLTSRAVAAREDSGKRTTHANVIIVGAGIAGITAGKRLTEKGVSDFLILEGQSIIGGRMHKEKFGGVFIEKGANWVEGVNGPELNPILPLVRELGLRNAKSDYTNEVMGSPLRMYEELVLIGRVCRGLLPPQKGAAAFNLSDAIFSFDADLGASLTSRKKKDISILTAQRLFGSVPVTPVEMALDYYNYDYEFAEPPRVTSLENTEPLPTFKNFGPDLYFVSDPRGYGTIIDLLASKYLKTKNGHITDSRLKLNKVVWEIEYSSKGATLRTEDGDVYTAEYVILTVSIGVLQSQLIKFKPDLPAWKLVSLYEFDMALYTKIFVQFPYTFWPTGPGTQFFVYADERRGYYPIWQHLDGEYPGSNIVMVTVTDDESRRIEQQSDKETAAEIRGVLAAMFQRKIPDVLNIFVPRWGKERLFRGAFSNWPIGVDTKTFERIQAPVKKIYFSGEHTSEHYNGYVHGGYYSGIESADRLLQCKLHNKCE